MTTDTDARGGAGRRCRHVAIDFETAYEKGKYSVRELGHRLYCLDPRFEALMVATYDGATSRACKPADYPWHDLHGARLIAHNAGFDSAVFERLAELGTIPADVIPAGWCCTASAAAYFGLPRDLAGAVAAVFGETVDKGVRDALGELGAAAIPAGDLEEYAAADARWAWRLWDRLAPRWPEVEQDLAAATDAMGRWGMRLDVEAAVAAAETARAAADKAGGAVPWRPIASVKAFREWCQTRGVVPPASTSRAYLDAVQEDGIDGETLAALRAVQAYRRATRTAAVLEAMTGRVDPATGRMVYQLKYFGAGRTGRWSGGGGLNVQNFNRAAGEDGVDLRGLLVPARGCVFVTADYAQVEARVLLWLAREEEMLDLIRDGMDLYEAGARRMLGYTDPEPLKKKNPALRQLAKGMILGLGFGMGAKRFVEASKTLGGVALSEQEAADAVRAYRNANMRVVELWQRLEDAFGDAAGKGSPCYGLPLPSGRILRYWSPAVIDGQMTAAATKGGDHEPLHRGTLCENLVQATARDILADAWRRCMAAGFYPVLSCHDELVFEVAVTGAETALERIRGIMERPPAWQYAEALPLAVETAVVERYCK